MSKTLIFVSIGLIISLSPLRNSSFAKFLIMIKGG